MIALVSLNGSEGSFHETKMLSASAGQKADTT